ncbi:TetR/AcrR family transcriptional regulator [Rhodococcus sp. 3Y1]
MRDGRRRRPALYRQFGDKDGLLAAVVEAGFFEYLEGKRAATPSDDPVADLRAGWDAHTAFALAHPAHYRLMHSPSAQAPTPPCRLRRYFDPFSNDALRQVF